MALSRLLLFLIVACALFTFVSVVVLPDASLKAAPAAPATAFGATFLFLWLYRSVSGAAARERAEAYRHLRIGGARPSPDERKTDRAAGNGS